MASRLTLVILITLQPGLFLAFHPVIQIDSGAQSQNLEENITRLRDRQAHFAERMIGITNLVKEAYNETKIMKERSEEVDKLAADMKEFLEITKIKSNLKTFASDLKQAKELVKDSKPQEPTTVDKLAADMKEFLEITKIKSNLKTFASDLKQAKELVKDSKPQEPTTYCPTSKGYVKVTGSICIKLSERSKNYHDATDSCKKEHAELITFKSEAEQEAVTNYINSLGEDAYDHGYKKLLLYVGIQRETDGSFHWIGNSTFSGDWKEEPSPATRYSQKCGVLVKGGLRSSFCLQFFRFICRI